MCTLCQSNPFVDWHSLEDGSAEPFQAGTAAGGSSNGTSISFNQNLVDQLDSANKWLNSDFQTAGTITFGFTTSNAFASGWGEATGWSATNAAQQAAVREMMGLWDDLIATSIVENTSSPDTADIKISNTTTNIGYAHAYFPGMRESRTVRIPKSRGPSG